MVSDNIDLNISPHLAKIIEGLDSVTNVPSKFGTFHKVANHIHTPQSYDYDLDDTGEKEKNKLHVSEKRLIEIASKLRIIPDTNFSFDYFQDEEFSGPEEELKFLIQAKKIVDKGIDAVIITDHNTITGCPKIQKAMYILRNLHRISRCSSIIWGIEISCADKNHVVGIFDKKNKHTIKRLQDWIDNYVISEKFGTYKSAIDVLRVIHSFGGIGYIAHMSSSELLFGEHSLSAGYKKKLFNLPFMKLIGLKDLSQTHNMLDKIKKYRDRPEKLSVILDEDSHTLNGLGTKTFWIKGENLDFNTIKTALKDFELTTQASSVPECPQTFIKAIYLDCEGFLKANPLLNNDALTLKLSDRLNCFIGGRGTGKSTVLELINLLLSQQLYDEKTLMYLLNQGTFAALIRVLGKDYYFVLNSSSHNEENRENNSRLIQDYSSLRNKHDHRANIYENRQARKALIRGRIQVYEKAGPQTVQEIKNGKQKLLDNSYTRQFSVRELVNLASSDTTGDNLSIFVLDLLARNLKTMPLNLSNREKVDIRLRSLYNKIPSIMENRKNDILNFIDDFNNNEKDQLKLQYSQIKLASINFPWEKVLDIYSGHKLHQWFGQRDYQFNIRYGALVSYLDDLSKIIDPFKVVFLILDSDFSQLDGYLNLSDFLEINPEVITNNDLIRISDEKNAAKFINELYRIILIRQDIIEETLISYINNLDQFNLFFNVNNKASIKTQSIKYMDVSQLSMGQKVVAMMSFILAYDNYTNDLNPLIIDQPEDNLDNQYIYNNLVRDLREIKGKRQVILATHNSTIVVNSGAEQVAVMESDGKNGWVSKTGFAMDIPITKRIVSILEGGAKALRRKIQIYNLD